MPYLNPQNMGGIIKITSQLTSQYGDDHGLSGQAQGNQPKDPKVLKG